jgi:hypothetical protein
MSRVFDPIASSTSDGQDITLCRILEATTGMNQGWDQVLLSNYTGANPGTIQYRIGGQVVSTLTLTWIGDNLTSVTRS